MTPPANIFGFIPIAVGVYIALGFSLALSMLIFYRRVISLIRLGKKVERFDQPLRRLLGAVDIVIGQRRVLQSLSLKRRDLAGLGHALIFWGFLGTLTSYLILIFGEAA